MSTKAKNLSIKFALIIGIILAGELVTFAQNKGTCLIDNKVKYDCDLRHYRDLCMYRGQVLPCNKAPMKRCADSGPLIIKLNSATGYYERSLSYSEMFSSLFCRGIYIGLYAAASDITRDFSRDRLGIGREADKFLQDTSARLARLNGKSFKEIIESRKLRKSDGMGYLSNPVDIDRELVRREQRLVQAQLNSLTYSEKSTIISQINVKIKKWIITQASPSIRAMAAIRNSKRKTDRRAEFDYGDINDRIAVGDILTSTHRKKPVIDFGFPVKKD